jgi:replication factor C subunit 3/5
VRLLDITKLKTDRGLALQDLIAGTYEVLETIELPTQSRVYLLDALATCEWVQLGRRCA